MDRELVVSVRNVLELLAGGEYEKLEKMTRGVRLSATELRQAVEGYPGTLINPPTDFAAYIDAIPIDGSLRKYSATVPLWTIEEGRSDLSIELTIAIDGVSNVVEIDNLHVL